MLPNGGYTPSVTGLCYTHSNLLFVRGCWSICHTQTHKHNWHCHFSCSRGFVMVCVFTFIEVNCSQILLGWWALKKIQGFFAPMVKSQTWKLEMFRVFPFLLKLFHMLFWWVCWNYYFGCCCCYFQIDNPQISVAPPLPLCQHRERESAPKRQCHRHSFKLLFFAGSLYWKSINFYRSATMIDIGRHQIQLNYFWIL